MAPLCRYYPTGDCRHGASCRFEHPRDFQNTNRYSVLQNAPNPTAPGRAFSSPADPLASVKNETIIADLSTERPQWILSAYTPAPKAPAQLFGGPVREQSFEEMRLHYYNGLANGDVDSIRRQTDTLIGEAEMQTKNALSDVNGAVNFIRRAQNEHPNRIDISEQYTKNSTQSLSGQSFTQMTRANILPPANNGQPQPAGTFGQPSSLGLKPNPFSAQSTFSQPSRLGPGTFGQPSVLGQKPNPFGTTKVAANSHGSVPYSSFATMPNPFGAPSQPVTSSPFAQQPQPIQSNPFGQATSATGPNLFGRTSNPFTTPNTNPFGRPEEADPFRRAAEIGRNEPHLNSSNPNTFGQPTMVESFGQPSRVQSMPTANTSSPITNVSLENRNNPYPPNANFRHPPLQGYSSQDHNQNLTMFKGKHVIYQDGKAGTQGRDGSWEKIWFPNGPPPYQKVTEMDDDVYTEAIKADYLHSRETGEFRGGIMPLLPPKREWCLWDF